MLHASTFDFVVCISTALNGSFLMLACHNSGRTPKGSVQGAISTALTLAHQLKRIEPIEKEKLLNITYYRVAPEILDGVSTSEPRVHLRTRPRKWEIREERNDGMTN